MDSQVTEKLIKLLKLRDNYAASAGEKDVASRKIADICAKHNIKIEGNQIILPGSQEPVEQRLGTNPNRTNTYVIFNGVKYYGKVPKEVYQKQQEFVRQQTIRKQQLRRS